MIILLLLRPLVLLVALVPITPKAWLLVLAGHHRHPSLVTCLVLALFLPSHHSMANVNRFREILHQRGISHNNNLITTKSRFAAQKIVRVETW